ncbi:precursor of CEP5-like [Mangifera indica]|uniref:precursor of CEP5-like n=1 Tax=Mangifera indica TaxID=29780 RepID=UPI001CFC0168|nr:precursor of CEP5-like [Mangifera indica]
MAQNKHTFACLVLVLIFCQEIQSIEGRHLKLERQNEFPKLQIYNKILEEVTRELAKQKSNLHGDENTTVTAANDNVSPPTAPSLPVGESPSPPPKRADDFRPTAPGHSPGVGHAIQN